MHIKHAQLPSPPCCPIPQILHKHSYHFSDFLEEKVILSCKGMHFFAALLSPEWCILFWDEELFLLHWYIIAANRNHCLQTVSRDQFRPHTLWPWHLRKTNPTLNLQRELKTIIIPLQRVGCSWGLIILQFCCWSIGEKMFDSFCGSWLILLLYNRVTPAEASLSLMQICLTFELDGRLLSERLWVTT